MRHVIVIALTAECQVGLATAFVGMSKWLKDKCCGFGADASLIVFDAQALLMLESKWSKGIQCLHNPPVPLPQDSSEPLSVAALAPLTHSRKIALLTGLCPGNTFVLVASRRL
jgi:hypothetical protein